MATETAALAIGVIALVSTIETCHRGYVRLIATAAAMPSSSREFVLDLQIEHYRFDLYWQYMGKTETGTDIALMREQPPPTQELIAGVASKICELLRDSNHLAAEYGGAMPGTSDDLEEAQGHTPGPASPHVESRILQQLEQLKQWRSQPPSAATSTASVPISNMQKARWVWRDANRAQKLTADLKKYNDTLWTALSPVHARLLKLAAPSFILPGLSDEASLAMLDSKRRGNLLDESLAALSRLRRAVAHALGQEDGPQAASRIAIPPGDIQISTELTETTGSRTKRAMGLLNGVAVLIEYREIDAELVHRVQETLRRRLHQLAVVLSEPYHPSLRILPCLGVWSPDPANDRRYGLVFRVPTATSLAPVKFVTLAAMLSSTPTPPRPPLGDRFKLALALSIAIMQLHAAGWYHKGIRPENIAFRQVAGAAAEVTEPRLLGFEFSRPATPAAESLDGGAPAGVVDLYAHPERQAQGPQRTPFRCTHDYYALGMCLLEIVLWEPLARVKERLYGASPERPLRTAAEWAVRVQESVFTEMAGRYGEIYRDVILACLSGKLTQPRETPAGTDDPDAALHMAFFNDVIRRLAECRA